MYTIKLLEALSLDEDGIQITMNKDGATIDTGYHPRIRGKGKTILAAAKDTARLVLQNLPDTRVDYYPKQVVTALKKYKEHIRNLQ